MANSADSDEMPQNVTKCGISSESAIFATVLDYGFRVCTVCYIEANLEHEKSYVIWKVSNVKSLTSPTKVYFGWGLWSIYDLGSKVWERSGSVVECLTRDLGAAGWSLTGVTALWSLSKTHLSYLSTGSTQEGPSLHN